MTVDFSQFIEYCNKYSEMTNEFETWLENWIYEMAERVIARTKPRTPVRTGQLRDAWTIGEIRRSENGIEVDILNSKKYASYVELGHAGVYIPDLGVTMHTKTKFTPGKFMLKISMNEIQEQMPKRFDRDFKAFLKEKGLE